ncbi:hypothetical protein [Spongiactinospora sp. 9N601]|uniref:hypothetical protein n=1 Tax=Spongiactinospora sp. 9N601 TaxID=3375149 RepID=UPI0037AFE017
MTTPPVPAVLGIDPGRRWTAGVLRAGDTALHGWTLGPVDASGHPDPTGADSVHDLAAWGRYMVRIIDAIEDTIARHKAGAYAAPGGPVVLAVEMVVPPGGRIALADWLIPRQIVAALVAYDPGAVLVAPGGHGKARPVVEHYPPALWPTKGATGGRPASWGPCESRRGERDHERAAWDVAGVALAALADDDVGGGA